MGEFFRSEESVLENDCGTGKANYDCPVYDGTAFEFMIFSKYEKESANSR